MSGKRTEFQRNGDGPIVLPLNSLDFLKGLSKNIRGIKMAEYSISQIGTFENCPLQYRLNYVDRIKRYEEGVEAFLGQRFHEAMEWLYRERAFRVVSLEELLAYYEKQWAEKWHAEGKISREDRTAAD